MKQSKFTLYFGCAYCNRLNINEVELFDYNGYVKCNYCKKNCSILSTRVYVTAGKMRMKTTGKKKK